MRAAILVYAFFAQIALASEPQVMDSQLSPQALSIEIPHNNTPLSPTSPSGEHVAYIPQHYDHTEEFHRESVCCFRLRRWFFQPLSVVLQLTAGGLVAGGQYCMENSPETARILNGVGLGVGVAAFVVNTLLLKIDNKLEDMDNYIMQHREGAQ